MIDPDMAERINTAAARLGDTVRKSLEENKRKKAGRKPKRAVALDAAPTETAAAVAENVSHCKVCASCLAVHCVHAKFTSLMIVGECTGDDWVAL